MTEDTLRGQDLTDEMLENFRKQPIQIVKKEKIKLTESIEMVMPNGLKRWVKIRVSGEGFTIEEAATNAKTKFEKALNVILSNPSLPITSTDYNTGEQGVQGLLVKAPHQFHQPPPVINLEVERVSILIENATSVKELRSYGEKAVCHGLMDMYELKLSELQNK